MTTEKMIIGRRTSPDTGVGSFWEEDTSRRAGEDEDASDTEGGLEPSRERGGGSDLTFDDDVFAMAALSVTGGSVDDERIEGGGEVLYASGMASEA